MPAGSPIDQWWKSHRPALVSTNATTSVHLVCEGSPRAYCGHRGDQQTEVPQRVTCSACIAARRADASIGEA